METNERLLQVSYQQSVRCKPSWGRSTNVFVSVFECSGQSIIIDCPIKTFDTSESGGHLKSLATVEAHFHVLWDDDVADALKSHCQFLIARWTKPRIKRGWQASDDFHEKVIQTLK